MARTIQNQVPPEFDALYSPILALKKLLMSKAKELEAKDFIHGLMLVHYSSFLMCNLYHQMGRDIVKILETRKLVEEILKNNQFDLSGESMSKLISFIDNLGKELNITAKAYLYIAMYEGHLDAEVYRHFHPTIGVYDFVDSHYISPEVVEKLKIHHDVSIKALEILKMPIDKRKAAVPARK